jgi:hypothetical protein
MMTGKWPGSCRGSPSSSQSQRAVDRRKHLASTTSGRFTPCSVASQDAMSRKDLCYAVVI